MRSRLAALLCVATIAGCGGGAQVQWAPLKLEELPGVDAHPGKGWVALRNERRIAFDLDPSTGEPYAEVETRFDVRVLTEAGRKAARVAEKHHPDLYPVTAFGVRLVAPGAKAGDPPTVRTWDREHAADVPQVNGSIYSEARVLGVTPSPLPPGSVVERRVTRRFADLRVFSLVHGFEVGGPVREARLVVDAPKGWRVDHVALRGGEHAEFAPVVRDEGGRTIYTWERRDLPGTPPEDFEPADPLGETVWVRLGAWRGADGRVVENLADHRATSAYRHALERHAYAPDDAIRARVAELLAGAPDDPRDRARRLYDWVRSQVRYCGIYFGMGGWVPHPAPQIHAARYGDCKDKATLLHSMLAVAGIPSRLGSLYSHNGVPTRAALPTVAGNHNHVILAVDLPDGTVFADPTDRSVPFGRLPFRDQGAELLPTSDPGSDLVRTPMAPAEVNLARFEADLTLAADGTATGTFVARFLGTQADRARSSLVDLAERGRREDLAARFGLVAGELASLDLVEHLEPPDADTPLVARGRLAARDALGVAGDGRTLRLSDLVTHFAPVLRETAQRVQPVVLGSPRRYVHRLRITPPAGLAAVHLPELVRIDEPYGRFEMSWTRDGEALVVERVLELSRTVVPAAEFGTLKAFADHVNRAERRAVVLAAGGAP